MMRTAGATAWRLMWLRGEPDPRVLQLGFTVLLVAEAGLRVLGGVPDSPGSWLMAALALAATLTVVVGCVPARWRRGTIPVIAAVDIGIVGVALLSGEDGGLGLLVVLPALWLGRRYGEWGALASVAASALLITVPGLLVHGVGGAPLTYLVMIPFIAGVSSLAISGGLDVARSAQARAERGERELARALETIQAHQDTSRAIFDAAGVGLMLLDHDGELRAMNQRYGDFISLSLPEGSGLAWPGHTFAADGVTPLGPDEIPSARAARGEEFDDFRMWCGADPRTRRAVSVSARHAATESGGFLGAALAGTDITDLMQALAVKDQFVALVSHELRTPLTSIVGYVSILLEDEEDLPERVMRQLTVIARNTERLQRLVADLLQEAQHPDGAMPVDRARIDLGGIVRDCVHTARPAAERTGVELVLRCPSVLWVDADAHRFAQVVDNLVSNAVKYSLAGGQVAVELRARATEVQLIVSDAGIGICESDQSQLFTRFFRAQEAHDRAIQGIGLGLSITKSIVESHGGRIEVDSEPGRGSRFRVVLPLHIARLAS
ncbi:sensor histidine kinase [Nocardioides endophyticus]|uniref:histidine kinase n=1 Tax=Nocardioides endophyticus TaxID=1353775 RepID=A0ABP8ZB16_9ACTN